MGSLIGSGMTDSYGGQLQPSINDIEQTGMKATVQKNILGLTKEMDPVNFPLTQQGGNVWKYQASSDGPVLAPLVQLRTSANSDPETDDSYKEVYNDLLGQHPQELQDGLNTEQQFPFNDRDSDYIVLDNVLTTLAKTVAWTDQVAQTPAPETLPGERMQMANQMPQAAFQNALDSNQDLVSSLQDVQGQIGPNDPNYDTIQNALNNAQNFNQSLSQTPSSDNLATVSSQIDDANQNLTRDLRDNSYQILGDSMGALSTASAALSMPGLSPSLYLGLAIANQGNDDPALGGIFTPSFNTLSQNMTDGLADAMGWNDTTDSAKTKGLGLIVDLLGTMGIVGGSYLGKEGIGPFPNLSEPDLTNAKLFSTEVGLTYLLSTGALESVTQDLAQSVGVQGKALAPVTSALSLWTLMLGIQGAGGNNSTNVNQLLEGIQPQLLTQLKTLGEFVSPPSQTDEQTPLHQGVDVYLSQATIALQNNDYDGFKTSLDGFLDLIQHPTEQTTQDINHTASFGDVIQKAFDAESSGRSITGISQA